MTYQRRAAVIGGSIAGCASAVALCRAGWDITLYERSSSALTDRGAGITMLTPDLQRLQAAQMISHDIPRYPVSSYHLRWRTDNEVDDGQLLGTPVVPNTALHWGDLYRDLRARVPAACFRTGCAVTGLAHGQDSAIVTLEDGGEHTFDLVISADGYQSLGRQLIGADSGIEYAGYVAWRGLIPEQAVADSSWLTDTVQCARHPGIWSAFYLLPGPGGSLRPGTRWINWLVYLKTEASDLPALCTDSNGVRYSVAVPPGGLSEQAVSTFMARVNPALPKRLAAICARSQDTFLQAIYQADTARYVQRRVALVGDAGVLASPLSASGALKALFDAAALSDALSASEKLDSNLSAWSEARQVAGHLCYRLGRHRARALLFDEGSDWSKMDTVDFNAWFKASQSLPEE